MRRVTLRGDPKAPLGTSSKPLQAHQTRDLVPSDADALGNQLRVNPWAAVDPFAGFVDAPDLSHQLSIPPRSSTLRPGSPGVVAAGRDLQQAAHHAHRIAIAAAINAGVLHFDRLAKYAAASLKKSRSFVT